MAALAVVLAVERQHVYRLRTKYGAAPAEARAPSDVVRITVDLPRRCVEWLELEALRRKQRAAEGRPRWRNAPCPSPQPLKVAALVARPFGGSLVASPGRSGRPACSCGDSTTERPSTACHPTQVGI